MNDADRQKWKIQAEFTTLPFSIKVSASNYYHKSAAIQIIQIDSRVRKK